MKVTIRKYDGRRFPWGVRYYEKRGVKLQFFRTRAAAQKRAAAICKEGS